MTVRVTVRRSPVAAPGAWPWAGAGPGGRASSADAVSPGVRSQRARRAASDFGGRGARHLIRPAAASPVRRRERGEII